MEYLELGPQFTFLKHNNNDISKIKRRKENPGEQMIMKSNASTVSSIISALTYSQTERELVLLIFSHEGLCSPVCIILSIYQPLS